MSTNIAYAKDTIWVSGDPSTEPGSDTWGYCLLGDTSIMMTFADTFEEVVEIEEWIKKTILSLDPKLISLIESNLIQFAIPLVVAHAVGAGEDAFGFLQTALEEESSVASKRLSDVFNFDLEKEAKAAWNEIQMRKYKRPRSGRWPAGEKEPEPIQEDAALEILRKARSAFGWSGPIFTRADAEEWAKRHLTDEEWGRVTATPYWKKGLNDRLTERAWDLVASAMRTAEIEEARCPKCKGELTEETWECEDGCDDKCADQSCPYRKE